MQCKRSYYSIRDGWNQGNACYQLRDEKDDFIDPFEAEQVEIVLYKVF